MIYYDNKGRRVEFTGSKAYIYNKDGEIKKQEQGILYKEYFSYSVDRIQKSIFEFIKSIANNNLVKLQERFYNVDGIVNYKDFIDYMNLVDSETKFRKDPYKIDLYTFEEVMHELYDILSISKDYLLENGQELMKLADLFTENRVVIKDLTESDLVCTKDRIVLTNPDMYYFEKDDKKMARLKLENRQKVLIALKNLCYKSGCIFPQNEIFNIRPGLDRLFDESIDHAEFGIDVIEKKLANYKTPVVYLAKKR